MDRLGKSLIIMMLARLADQFTTDAGIRMGYTEGNPYLNLGYGTPLLILSFVALNEIHESRIVDSAMYSLALSMWYAFVNNMLVMAGLGELPLMSFIPISIVAFVLMLVKEGFIILDYNIDP